MGARKEILDIHLKSWTPTPAPSLINYLSQKTVGYCGADLKVLIRTVLSFEVLTNK